MTDTSPLRDLEALIREDLQQRAEERTQFSDTLRGLQRTLDELAPAVADLRVQVRALDDAIHRGDESLTRRVKTCEQTAAQHGKALFGADGSSKIKELEGTVALLRSLVFGFVALVLVAVVGGLIALVVIKPG